MIGSKTLRKGWALLDAREKRSAAIVLLIAVFAALSAAVMVGSILPFLSVLSDPELIRESAVLSRTYDIFGFGSDYAFLLGVGVASLCVIVLANAIQILRVYVVTRFAMMRIHSISRRLLATYLCQPYEFFLNQNSGALGTNVLAEAQQVVDLFFRPVAEVMASALTILAIVALLLAISPLIALSAFAIVGATYGATFLISRQLVGQLGKIRRQSNQRRFQLANEILGGVKDIKLLGRERAYLERYSEPSACMARTQTKVSIISQTPQYVVQAIAFGGIIVLCLVLMTPEQLASDAALGGVLPLIGSFALGGQRLIPELSRLYSGMTQLSFGAAAVDAVYEDMRRLSGQTRLPGDPPPALGMKDKLELDALSYRYPGAQKAGLTDLSLSIRAGERIGIVGTTGAGKTTLADILLGLLRPQAGRVVIDGTTLTEDNLQAWYQTVGYVPQDIFLVDADISENIALGVPRDEIDHDKVREAARIAQVDSFVTRDLDHGYETHVGERGVRLSGGQRQRLGIARALYHDADLIVLDEATSALDNQTEAEVMVAIDALPGDKTVVMIAHRLTTLTGCDRIIVLDQGRLAGFDNWDALMRDNTVFRNIAQVNRVA